MSLSYAFDITKYKCDKLDPKYELLPNSFKACIDMLEKLLETQRELPINKNRSTIELKGNIYPYILSKYPDVINKLLDIDKEYTSLITEEEIDSTYDETYTGPYQNDRWVNSLSHIDKNWFKSVRKINDIRNIAAHKYNPEEMYKALGFNGKTAFEKSKMFCLNQIYKMFYILKKE